MVDLDSDFIADITVKESSQALRTQTAGRARAVARARERTPWQAGDSLSKISKQFYGRANEFIKIFDANRSQSSSPDEIRPGQQLVIPE